MDSAWDGCGHDDESVKIRICVQYKKSVDELLTRSENSVKLRLNIQTDNR